MRGTESQIRSTYCWHASFHRQNRGREGLGGGQWAGRPAEVAQCPVYRLAINPFVPDDASLPVCTTDCACWLLPVLCFSIFITHSNLMLPAWEEKFPLWTKEKTQLSDFCYMSLIFGEIS